MTGQEGMTVEVALLVLGSAALLGLLASYLSPLQWPLRVAGMLSAVQLYTVPLASVYLSAAHLGGLASWKALPSLRVLAREPWLYAVLLLILAQLCSILWSPTPFQAVRQLIYALPFVFLLAAAVQLTRTHRPVVERTLVFALHSALIVALLVVLFRLSPALKMQFLLSPLTRLFVSRNLLDDVFASHGVYTALDPGKSGGLLINANTAAAYLGLTAMLAWHLAGVLGARSLKLTAALCWGAVFFTGSKAGILLTLSVPAIPYVVATWRSPRIVPVSLVLSTLLVLVVLVGLWTGPPQLLAHGGYVADSAYTLDSRLEIWHFGLGAFKQHPLLGLGFGGWEQGFWPYAVSRGISPFLPPHNALLALWAQSGLLAVIAGAAFMLLLLWRLARLACSDDAVTAAIAVSVLGALVWVFIQAQGENFGLIGETHLTPVMALALGYLFGRLPPTEAS